MSPREQLQEELYYWIESRSHSKFTAPYGVISSLEPLKNGKGKVRTITFGVARYLDATITIWSTDKITVQAAGGLAYKIEGSYGSKEELIKKLEEL